VIVPRVPVRRDYLDGRFGQIHYRIARPALDGGKPPLLCFHMSPNSGRIYETFLGAIGTDRIAVAPDTPGLGDSDPPADAPGIEDYAGAMGDVMDALKLRQVDVMGYHTGSETCVALALARPAQVRKLILTSAPIFTPEELKDHREKYAHEPLAEDGQHLVKKWKGHMFWRGPGKTREMVADEFCDALRNPLISWWGHNAAFSYDMGGQMPKVTQPMLVLNPDDDLHAHTWRAEGKMQRGRILHLKGWGHGYLNVHTDAAAKIVRDFLDE
jgi:pimeloyl-ACP methyl ester carboxylesterase